MGLGLGFSDALEFDACIPEFADVSEDAYRCGYAYAMDWIIKHHNGQQLHPRLSLVAKLKSKNNQLAPIIAIGNGNDQITFTENTSSKLDSLMLNLWDGIGKYLRKVICLQITQSHSLIIP
jgi:hypothetical protein